MKNSLGVEWVSIQHQNEWLLQTFSTRISGGIIQTLTLQRLKQTHQTLSKHKIAIQDRFFLGMWFSWCTSCPILQGDLADLQICFMGLGLVRLAQSHNVRPVLPSEIASFHYYFRCHHANISLQGMGSHCALLRPSTLGKFLIQAPCIQNGVSYDYLGGTFYSAIHLSLARKLSSFSTIGSAFR